MKARNARYASGSHAMAGRGKSPNPGQSIAIVVNVEASCSAKGRISPRVEIELRAGSIRTVGPLPRVSDLTSINCPRQRHSMQSSDMESYLQFQDYTEKTPMSAILSICVP